MSIRQRKGNVSYKPTEPLIRTLIAIFLRAFGGLGTVGYLLAPNVAAQSADASISLSVETFQVERGDRFQLYITVSATGALASGSRRSLGPLLRASHGRLPEASRHSGAGPHCGPTEDAVTGVMRWLTKGNVGSDYPNLNCL